MLVAMFTLALLLVLHRSVVLVDSLIVLLAYRRFEVGADATDARADNPGRVGGIELHPGKAPLSSPSLNLSLS